LKIPFIIQLIRKAGQAANLASNFTYAAIMML